MNRLCSVCVEDSRICDCDLGRKYSNAVNQPIVLSPEDEQKVYNLIMKNKRCRGCNEKISDGCLSGCTDRD